MLSFSPVVGIGTPPTLHPQPSVPPTAFGSGGGAHSLARDGVGESQFQFARELQRIKKDKKWREIEEKRETEGWGMGKERGK